MMAVAASAVIVAVALVDHAHERAAGQRADVSAWYCKHGLGRCRATKPTTIERRWELREKVYEAGLGVGIAVFFGAFAARLRSRFVRAPARATFLTIFDTFIRWRRHG
jgi:hypothetical protein